MRNRNVGGGVVAIILVAMFTGVSSSQDAPSAPRKPMVYWVNNSPAQANPIARLYRTDIDGGEGVLIAEQVGTIDAVAVYAGPPQSFVAGDLDGDTDVDLRDFRIFQVAFSGP